MSSADFDVERLLSALIDGQVDFVVIGGIAAVLHGSARATFDLDICFAYDAANLDRLGAVLTSLGAHLRGIDEDVPFIADGATLRRADLLTLSTAAGDLDVMRAPDGAPRYDALRAHADEFDVGGFVVRVASIEDLIAMKTAADREKDRADVVELEALLRLRGT